MHEFFSGWRRKAGCVALVMALGQGRTRSHFARSHWQFKVVGRGLENPWLTVGRSTRHASRLKQISQQ